MKLFPKLPSVDVNEIIDTCMDVSTHISYKKLSDKISEKGHPIHPIIYQTLVSTPMVRKETPANKDRELFLDHVSCRNKIKKIARELKPFTPGTLHNSHNFFNLALMVNYHRRNLEMRVRQKRDYVHPMDIKSFTKRCETIVDLEKIRSWSERNTHLPVKLMYPCLVRDLKSTYLFKRSKQEVEIKWDEFNNSLFQSYIRLLYPNVSKTINEDDNNPYSRSKKRANPEYIKLLDSHDRVREFCKTPDGWDTPGKSKLKSTDKNAPVDMAPYEITSGIPLGNMSNIGGVNFFSFLFKDQVEKGFFEDVEHMMFHEQLIVVSKKDELISLMPNDIYRQLVLTNKHNFEVALNTDDAIQLERFKSILYAIIQEKKKDHFEDSNAQNFMAHLEAKTSIKFINTLETINKDEVKELHQLNWGNISKIQQDNFAKLIDDLSFIFPRLIPEIHLNINTGDRETPPDNDKDLLYYIDRQRNDRDLGTTFNITQEDLYLLARSNRFYTTILVERAFAVVFNRELLNNGDNMTAFRECMGELNISKAINHFNVRGKSIHESRIIRKLFIQNCLLFFHGKKDQLNPMLSDFFFKLFSYQPVLKLN